MHKIRNSVNSALFNVYVRSLGVKEKFKNKLTEKDGNFFTEHGLAIVIVVVIAAIILTAVVALFKDKIFPGLGNKVDSFFTIS